MPRDDHKDWTDDILWGVDGPDGIAAYVNKRPSEVYYLISLNKKREERGEKPALPVKKHSHRIITASKRELRAHFGFEKAQSLHDE